MPNTVNRKTKILLIEDEPVVGRLCKRVLVAEGFDVDIAVNGRIARDAVSGNHYDLCVSDIKLPEITGIQFYEILKKSSSELANNLIFMTGDTMSTHIHTYLQESGVPCLLKPFTPDDLIAAVRKILEQSELPK
jgi:DNA-binding response OmpR family regulator